jgi:hypothetical protein
MAVFKKSILLFPALFLFANLAGAQAADPAAQPCGGSSFFNIVASSGLIGEAVWLLIFTMWPVGMAMGIISCISSALKKDEKPPLAFQWLMGSAVFYIFVGAAGVMLSMLFLYQSIIFSSPALMTPRDLAFAFSNALYIGSFTLLGMLPFMFFTFLSVFILHLLKQPAALNPTDSRGENA